MKFINLKTLYNEKVLSSFKGKEENIGINGVWFLEEKTLALGIEGISSDSFYLDDQRLKLNDKIMAETLFFYCFSENQIQNMYITINEEKTYKIKVPDWGNCYILKEKHVHTNIYCYLPANIGKKLAIYEIVFKLSKKTNIGDIEFAFNPCVHILAIGYN